MTVYITAACQTTVVCGGQKWNLPSHTLRPHILYVDLICMTVHVDDWCSIGNDYEMNANQLVVSLHLVQHAWTCLDQF